ncbi:hypothetical protein CDAR_310151 [Caerostris darwini]|uniref:Uncharacterized protein n=1 Tax=Caerostris darwini TaxID=1538125 RepID=A0AAV4WU62_9ARAC|nr:hypothetical protein CDAR_310151 [Caerostris darwini]
MAGGLIEIIIAKQVGDTSDEKITFFFTPSGSLALGSFWRCKVKPLKYYRLESRNCHWLYLDDSYKIFDQSLKRASPAGATDSSRWWQQLVPVLHPLSSSLHFKLKERCKWQCPLPPRSEPEFQHLSLLCMDHFFIFLPPEDREGGKCGLLTALCRPPPPPH